MRRDVFPHPSRKNALLEIFRSKSRRTAQETSANSTSIEAESSGIFNSGVVDECCKNQCTLSTLVSYCADSGEVSDINLDEVLFPGSDRGSTLSNEDLEYLLQKDQVASISNSSSEHNGHQMAYQDSESQTNRPNLGVFMRNRPVFIVLSQVEDERDSAAEEYRL
ncbi:uncharacterized protein LOC129228223 [Uloborus diversus]|uniref:uncharacterized protein LOC129228223 n=1 Tax=Uloborus diversus TaxID=327109 RepID=UPI0024093084|nr:uncharacterized protein LOC129228223 [Uloborus diversus]